MGITVGCGSGYDQIRPAITAASAAAPASNKAPGPPLLARYIVDAYFGDNIEVWREYLRDGKHQTAKVHWGEGRQVGAERWVVPVKWQLAGRLHTARWYVDLPLTKLADQEVDLELTGKMVTPANAMARILSRLPSVPDARERSVALFSMVGGVDEGGGGHLHAYAALSRQTAATRYVRAGVGVMPLLRGRSWMQKHRVTEKPRPILLDSHTIISISGQDRHYSLTWLRHRVRTELVAGAATWSKRPDDVGELNRVAASAFTIDPRFVPGWDVGDGSD